MNQDSNQDSQMRFEEIDPSEGIVFHARISDGDDIDEQAAPSVDDIDLQDDYVDDAVVASKEQGADIREQDAFSTDDIDLLNDHSDDAAKDSIEQTAPGDYGIDLQDDYVDGAVVASNEQGDDIGEQAAPGTDDIGLAGPGGDAVVASGERDAVENVASSGFLQEPDDEATDVAGMTMGMDWRTDRRRVAMESPGWKYPVSHHAFRVRAMTDEEFLAHVEDVKKHGLRLPIIRWRGAIIDGFHRLLACLEVGIEPTFKDVPDDVDPEAYVKSANRFRRHLTKGEMIEDAVGSSDGSKRGRRWASGAADYSAKLQNNPDVPLTQEEAAEQYEISLRTLAYGAKIFSQDSTASPELRQAVREDKIAVSDASKVVNEPPKFQRKAVELKASGESRTVVEGVAMARREAAGRPSEGADVVAPAYEKDGICIHRGNVTDLLVRVKRGSVDAVICAPGPDDDYGDSTPALAAIVASHALSTEGILVLAADPGRLPEQLARVTQRKNLNWICQVHLVFESGIGNTGEPHYIEQRTVPLLLFGKSGTRLDGGDDVIVVPPQPEESKNEPQSIQHAAELVIRRFVKPGQVVCIPDLSVGNRHLLIAAAKAGCKIIAADSNQSRVRRVVKELSKLPSNLLSDDRAGA